MYCNTPPFHKIYVKKSFYDHISSLVSQSVADKIVNMFGYYSEIKAMNAYDAYMTFKNDFGNIQYYRLKNGFSELCNVMAQTIKSQKSDIILQSKVVDVRKHSDTTYIVETCKNSFRGRKIIFATKPHQHKTFPILKDIHKYIDSVYQAPLIRIYAKYPTPCWFSNIHRTTTNNVLRQIIPIDKANGLIMVSYTDGKDIPIHGKFTYIETDKRIKKTCCTKSKYNISKPQYTRTTIF